jgi:hypothetical protein
MKLFLYRVEAEISTNDTNEPTSMAGFADESPTAGYLS